jgi:hypothetical protein
MCMRCRCQRHDGVERGLKPQKTKPLIYWFLPHCFLLTGIGSILEARDQHSPPRLPFPGLAQIGTVDGTSPAESLFP